MIKMEETKLNELLKDWPQIVKEYQKPDTTKAVLQVITSFGPFLLIWALMYWSLDVSYGLTLALGFLNAFFVVRIFIIQHDCGHRSYLKSQTWNNIVGQICSLISMIPFKYWARSHNFHHAHNGQLETRDIGDIDTLTVKEYKELDKWGRMKYRIYRMPVVTFIIGSVYYLFIHNRLPKIKMPGWKKTRQSLIYSNLFIVMFYGLLIYIFGWKTVLLINAPILTFFAVIAVWFFYVQHQHELTYKQWKANWNYLMSAIRGSSYYKLPKVFMWLTGNIGLHHIHHLSSLIPSYNLERCNRENPIFEEHVTILTFRESLKCMFNKLWDEQNQRMITFKEFYRLEKAQMA